MALKFLNDGYFAGKVGIGTDSPGATLDVSKDLSSTNNVQLIVRNTNGTAKGAGIGFYDELKNMGYVGINYSAVNWSTGRFTFALTPDGGVTAPVELMSILKSGNVGIGTTSPAVKLTVSENSSGLASSITNSNSTGSGVQITAGSGTNNSLQIRNYVGGELMRVQGNGNVGIGTTSPSAIGGHSGILTLYGSNATALVLKDVVSEGHLRFDDSNFKFTNSNGDVRVQIETDTGNVGIGTTSPLERLTVFSGTNESVFDALGVYNSVTGTSAVGKGAAIRIGKDVDGNYSTKIATIYEDNNPSYLQPAMAFFTMRNSYLKGSEVERMRIGSAGNIKFNSYNSTNNTGTPTYLLGTDASGNIVKTNTVPGSAAGPYLPLAGGTMTGVTQFNDHTQHGDQVYAKWGASNDLQIYHDGSNSYISDTGTGDLIITGGNDILFNDPNGLVYMNMNQSNSVELYYGGTKKLETAIVGVGTATTAGGTLIDGWITTTQANAINNTTIATTAYVNNKIALIPAGLVFQGTWNASTNTPTLTSGSGTTGNFYIVSVAGSTNLDGITDWQVGDWAVFIEQGASDQWEKIDNSSVLDGIGTGGRVTKWSGSGTSNTLTDSGISDASNAIAITINGNEEVGIGGSPFHKLDVFGTLRVSGTSTLTGTVNVGTTATKIVLTPAGDAYMTTTRAWQLSAAIGNTTYPTYGFYGDTGTGMYSAATDTLAFSTSALERIRITSGGNVGIGTTLPQQKLDVSSSTTYQGILVRGNVAPNVCFVQNTGTTPTWKAGISGNDGTAFSISTGAASTDKLIIKPSGDVGIGTFTPSSKLQVAGGIQMADDTDTASAAKVGTMRYRTGTEYVDVTGAELVTNGDFATDTNWAKGTGVTIASGVGTWTNAANNVGLTQSVTFTSNAYYRCNVTVSNYSSGSFRFRYPGISSPRITANGTYSLIIRADQSQNTQLFLQGETNGDANVNFSIDNVSVVEVTEEDASYADMCMQTGASTYEWVNIVRNTY